MNSPRRHTLNTANDSSDDAGLALSGGRSNGPGDPGRASAAGDDRRLRDTESADLGSQAAHHRSLPPALEPTRPYGPGLLPVCGVGQRRTWLKGYGSSRPHSTRGWSHEPLAGQATAPGQTEPPAPPPAPMPAPAPMRVSTRASARTCWSPDPRPAASRRHACVQARETMKASTSRRLGPSLLRRCCGQDRLVAALMPATVKAATSRDDPSSGEPATRVGRSSVAAFGFPDRKSRRVADVSPSATIQKRAKGPGVCLRRRSRSLLVVFGDPIGERPGEGHESLVAAALTEQLS